MRNSTPLDHLSMPNFDSFGTGWSPVVDINCRDVLLWWGHLFLAIRKRSGWTLCYSGMSARQHTVLNNIY